MASRLCLTLSTAALLALGGCTDAAPDPSVGDGLTIDVAALTLPGLSKVCYDLRVTNAAAGGGETVWSRGTPGLSGAGTPDPGAVCSDAYGNGAGGALSFVGPCDADGQLDADSAGERTNSVTLWFDGLYDASGAYLDPSGAQGWQDPCPPPLGCTRNVLCEENGDVAVEFDLTVMRRAQQGFFDVAVTFDDIFCSAKVDCALPGAQGGPIALVFDPATGRRVDTVVWAFACTDGDPGGPAESATHLYMDDVVLHCGSASYAVNPSAGPGNVYPGGVGAPPPLVQAMVFEGRELLTNGAADADKLYWNVALGLNAAYFAPEVGTAPDCVLETRATATRGPLVDGITPPDTSYPLVTVAVPINAGPDVICTQHGLNAAAPHEGVATTYTASLADGSGFATATFGYLAAASITGLATEPVVPLVDECAVPPGPCHADATCSDLAIDYTCVCNPGFDGDGVNCVDIDECLAANGGCDAHATCANTTGSRTCTCDAGYTGSGTSCTLIGVGLTVAANTQNYDVFTQAGSPTSPRRILVTLNAGVTVSSSSAATPAFRSGALPAGSIVELTNNGSIIGAGGDAGRGGGIDTRTAQVSFPVQPGQDGGAAIASSVPLIITNTGNIFGGGGGGGGGGERHTSGNLAGGGGGGGGAGAVGGALGAGGPGYSGMQYANGSPGTAGGATPGSGGAGGNYAGIGFGGAGGAGGAYGQPGVTGGTSNGGTLGGTGGAAGHAVRTDGAGITWVSGNNATQVKGPQN